MRVVEYDDWRSVARVKVSGPPEQLSLFAEIAQHRTNSFVITCYVVKVREHAHDDLTGAAHSPRLSTTKRAN